MHLRRTVPFTFIGDLSERKHPFLFTNAEMAANLRQRAQADPWTRGAVEFCVARGDDLVANPVELPSTYDGIWTDHYACLDCGVMITWRRDHPRDHLCPKCRTIYRGENYDAGWWTHYHWFLVPQVRDTGIAYLATGDEKYARAVHNALMQYAHRYESYPIFGQFGPDDITGSRITAETIGESLHFLIPLLMGYDFTASSAIYSAADHEQVRELSQQVVKIIRRFNPGQMNWQVLNNIGVAAASLLCRDRWLLDEVINGPVGFHYHMADSVLPYGFWFEGTIGYHCLVTRLFLEEAMMLKRSGITFAQTDRLRQMVDFVVNLSDDYGVLPVPGDSRPSKLSDNDHTNMIRVLQALVEDYPVAIEQTDAYHPGDYGSDYSEHYVRLIYGPLQTVTDRDERSLCIDLPDAGMSVVGGKNTQLFTRYARASGGHSHSDAMAITFNYQGNRLLVDSSVITYSHPAYLGYYIKTLSHNALLVDGATIAALPATRTLFVDEGPVLLFETYSDNLYPGVEQRRCTLLIDDRFLVDWYKVDSDREHTLDYVLHLPMGRLQPEDTGPMRDVELTEGGAYEFLQDVKQASGPGPGLFHYHPKAGPAAQVTVRSNPLGVTHLASAPGVNSFTDRTPMLLYRVRSDRARFLAATIPDPDSQAGKWQIRYLDQADTCPPGWLGVEISDGSTTHSIFGNETDETFKRQNIECRGDIVYLRRDSQGKTESVVLIHPKAFTYAGRSLTLPASNCIEIRQPGSPSPEIISH